MRIYDSKIFRLLRIKVLRNTSSQSVTRTVRARKTDDTDSVRCRRNGESVTGWRSVTGWARFLQGLRLLVFLSRFEDFNTSKTARSVTGVTGVTGSLQTFTRTREREPKCLALKVSTFISFLRKVYKLPVTPVTPVTPNGRNKQAIKQLQKIFRKDEISRTLPGVPSRCVTFPRPCPRPPCDDSPAGSSDAGRSMRRIPRVWNCITL